MDGTRSTLTCTQDGAPRDAFLTGECEMAGCGASRFRPLALPFSPPRPPYRSTALIQNFTEGLKNFARSQPVKVRVRVVQVRRVRR